jgi:hypothetical protein
LKRWRFISEIPLENMGFVGGIEVIPAETLFDAWYRFMLYATNDDGEDYLLLKHGCTDVKELKEYLTIEELKETIYKFNRDIKIKQVKELD